MSIPKSQKQWLVQGTDKGIDGLIPQDNVPIPDVGDNEVLVRLRGASLNYRDLIIPRACIAPFSQC
jgi:NADPH:quinone reductase-like Zn-dependent oxidoreductase